LPSLSVTLIVRDEQENLPDALRSCEALADEIVVVDTGSRDATPSIAREHAKVRLLHADFQDFSQAKGLALEQATGEWVLALDADERVSQQLADAIARLRASGELARHAGYTIHRQTRILGRTMTSMGLQRDDPLRLFRREGASYNRRPVHEGIVLPPGASVGRLEEPLLHHTFGGVDAYLRKIDLYTTLEIREGGRRFSLWHLVAGPPSTFLRFYVSRGGYRDGFQGFLWASLTAIGVFLRDVKLWIAREQAAGRLR
jgi:(heptosyl)LPS beta-1,4-glucosyltransferase